MRIITALLVLLIFVSCKNEEDMVSIHGVVRDATTNEVIPGVEIKLNNATQLEYQTISDADGNYEFEGVKAGNYRLSTSVTNYSFLGSGLDYILLFATYPINSEVTEYDIEMCPISYIEFRLTQITENDLSINYNPTSEPNCLDESFFYTILSINTLSNEDTIIFRPVIFADTIELSYTIDTTLMDTTDLNLIEDNMILTKFDTTSYEIIF